MQSKPDYRAPRPEGHVVSGPTTKPEMRVRPDHATRNGRSGPRDTGARRVGARLKASAGASMDYQQGFTSGPAV